MKECSDAIEFLEGLMPQKPAYGWSNEGMLEMLKDYLSENAEAEADLHDYFKIFKVHDLVDSIVKTTIAASLVACGNVYYEDVRDYLAKEEGWTQDDFNFYEAYRITPG